YNLDIILFTIEYVIFLEQTKTFIFNINKSIKLNRPFSLCTNDIDNDGDIDFYITQIYHEEHPALGGRNGEKNKLVLNNNGSFNPTNIPSIESTGIGLACSILDINQDGKKDIIVINDFGKDELFIQTNNLKFKNKAREFNFDDSGAGMNLSIIDFNDDPFWDIYVTMIDMFNKHLSFQLPDENSSLNRSKKILNTSTYLIGNQLYIGRPKKFERKTQNIFEPGLKGWGWGASFFDYDNDSFDDVYITNGRILYNENYTDEKNIFMINLNNKLYFSKSTSPESSAQNSRGVSAADFENKGNLDLIVRNPANAILYKNINKNTNNWIKIKLIGNKKNTFAIGATIEVTTKEKSKRKIILAETGFRSQEPYQKHFGLGSSEIESITVTWPNNLKTKLRKPIKTNQLITLTHPEMKPN
ncbi:MAG: CRTAC1 family protein, partial [Candidatus Margulisiibacteriota bacterium]